MAKAGRKSRLTPELQRQLVRFLSQCATIQDACAVAGIDDSTFYKWQQRGRDAWQQVSGMDDTAAALAAVPEADRPFVEFFDAVTRAEAKARTLAAGVLHDAMRPSTIKETTTEVLEETRILKDGTPFDYRRSETRTVERDVPPDWRAAVEYLKRRDKRNWSEKTEFTGQVSVNTTWADIVRQAQQQDDAPVTDSDDANPWA